MKNVEMSNRPLNWNVVRVNQRNRLAWNNFEPLVSFIFITAVVVVVRFV